LAGSYGSGLWDDRPLRIVQTTQANFPATLAAEGIEEGEVRAVLNVDAAGKLVDYLVTAYTRRELADELVANVREWTYEPARQRGEPVGSRLEVVFAFQARGMVISLTPLGSVAVTTNRLARPALTSLVCRPSELDEPVRAIHVVEPRHPGNPMPSLSPQPTVLIDFYIDREGRPRMPVVLRAAHEIYAIAAVDALMQWRFNPPARQGRPVIVRATQLFNFSERSP
jgi:outer membrane biosynthesis protein TonB